MRRWMWLGAAVVVGGGLGAARGQVVDSPGGGGVPMVPGGAGKGKEGAGELAGKVEYVMPSEEEQMSRELLELKSARGEAMGKYGAGDARVRDLEKRIREMQEKVGARSGVFVDGGAESGGVAAYPRIVEMFVAGGYGGAGQGAGLNGAGAEAGSGAGNGAVSGGASVRQAVAEDVPENVAVVKALGETKVSVMWDGVGLGKCVEEFREKAHVNVDVNWQALAAAGVDRNAPMSLSLVEVSAERALRGLLAQASPAAGLSYTIDGGVLLVSTKEDLQSSKYQVVKVFDVRDFLAADAGGYPAWMMPQVNQARVNGLIDTIKSVVAPDTWRDAGGTVGSIRELNGQLIVNQTKENMQAVAEVLRQLRGRGGG